MFPWLQNDYRLGLGPISLSEYEDKLHRAKQDKAPGGILHRIDLELVVTNPSELGVLYVSNRNRKLYLAVPVDTFIFDYEHV